MFYAGKPTKTDLFLLTMWTDYKKLFTRALRYNEFTVCNHHNKHFSQSMWYAYRCIYKMVKHVSLLLVEIFWPVICNWKKGKYGMNQLYFIILCVPVQKYSLHPNVYTHVFSDKVAKENLGCWPFQYRIIYISYIVTNTYLWKFHIRQLIICVCLATLILLVTDRNDLRFSADLFVRLYLVYGLGYHTPIHKAIGLLSA